MSLGSRRCQLRRVVAVLIMGIFAFECGEPLLAAGAAAGPLVEPVVATAGTSASAPVASAPVVSAAIVRASGAAGAEALAAAPAGNSGEGERSAPIHQPCACTQAATSLDAAPQVPVPSLPERAAPPQLSVRVPFGPTPEIPLRPPAARAA